MFILVYNLSQKQDGLQTIKESLYIADECLYHSAECESFVEVHEHAPPLGEFTCEDTQESQRTQIES